MFGNCIIYILIFTIENLKLKTKTLQCSQFLEMNIEDNSKLQSSTFGVKKLFTKIATLFEITKSILLIEFFRNSRLIRRIQ